MVSVDSLLLFFFQDTIVILNFYSVHNDKKFWKQPEVFNPERFLDGEGKFRQISGAIPFGIGKLCFDKQ